MVLGQIRKSPAIEAFGRLDLLCNNAAVHPLEGIEEHALESWRETFRVNVDGTMLCSKFALPHVRRQGSGAIVNLGSSRGSLPYARGGAYAASKAAIAMLTKVLALEAGPYGVRVNCIEAGSIRHRVRDGQDGAPPAHIPIGRRGRPDDVAQLVAFLPSDAAGYLTGSVITLDDGATASGTRVIPSGACTRPSASLRTGSVEGPPPKLTIVAVPRLRAYALRSA